VGQTPQFVINKRQQTVGRSAIARADLAEHLGDVGRPVHLSVRDLRDYTTNSAFLRFFYRIFDPIFLRNPPYSTTVHPEQAVKVTGLEREAVRLQS
jgi:hypothetical protein